MANVQTAIPFKVVPLRQERRKKFAEEGSWFPVPLTTVASHWLYEGEQRLDAGYHAQDAKTALRIVKDCGFTVNTVEQMTEPIYYPGRFKRIYAKTQSDGTPFLTASAMLYFRPVSGAFLANNTNAVEVCEVQPGWILVTRSGTVGRCVLVGKRLARFAITDDALRVQAKEILVGYLYAFLSTWIGQALISKDKYGSTIKHLEPHHLAGVPVPLLPDNEQKAIHAEIMRAYSLRDEANELLNEADELLHKKLGLPRFDESLVPYLPPPPSPKTCLPEIPHPGAFTVKASELAGRLDASYHVPVARTVVELLHKGKYIPVQLKKIVDEIFIPGRFKRTYVPKEYGVPFLQGSHLPQMKSYDLKYISKSVNAKHIKQCLIASKWILITRSGTIGRVALASSSQKGWAASEHLLRIIPDYSKGHPGYLAAFLMTPYGQHQLKAKIYGGVVDEITEKDTGEVRIPKAPRNVQSAIGELVVSAFEKKDEANVIEEAAIRKVEIALKEIE